jgi:very-short-patch-repair endonuclease
MTEWQTVATEQQGVLRRGQCDLPRRTATVVRRGLVPLGRNALVVAGSAPSAERALWLAACEIGDPMALSGLAALWLYGVPVAPPEQPEVLVPRPRVVTGSGVARVHRVVARELVRARVVRGLRVTSVPVALRRAGAEADAAALVTYVEHVLRLRLATVGQLWRALGHGLVGAAALRDALAVADPESHSEWERRLAALIRQAGLPRPRRQARLGGDRTYWTDFLFERHCLAVEVDGFAAHARPEEFVYGLRRSRRIRIAHGIDVLTYAPVEIRDRPDEVVGEIAAELARRERALHSA